jgi:putative acyl-CoA dehydrogenase
VQLAAGADARLDAAIGRLERELAEPDERSARRLLELLAVALQGSLLVRHGAPEVADAFCASRLDRPGGVYGTLPPSLEHAAIAERHRPRL